MEVNLNGANAHDTRAHSGPTHVSILLPEWRHGREREMFYLTMHSTHFIYGYVASDIWLRTILIVREETCCRHIGYSYWLTARVLLYAPSHRQDSTYHGLCYSSRGALAGTRNSPMKDRSDDPSHHERTLYLWAPEWRNGFSKHVICKCWIQCKHSQWNVLNPDTSGFNCINWIWVVGDNRIDFTHAAIDATPAKDGHRDVASRSHCSLCTFRLLVWESEM